VLPRQIGFKFLLYIVQYYQILILYEELSMQEMPPPPKSPIEIVKKYEKEEKDTKKRKRISEEKDARKRTRIPLKDKYVRSIMKGKKTVEGRINSSIFRRLSLGDTVTFFSRKSEVTVVINRVRRYSSFREMAEYEGVSALVPVITSVNDAVNLYRSFPRYREREGKFGVVALQLKIKDRALELDEE